MTAFEPLADVASSLFTVSGAGAMRASCALDKIRLALPRPAFCAFAVASGIETSN